MKRIKTILNFKKKKHNESWDPVGVSYKSLRCISNTERVKYQKSFYFMYLQYPNNSLISYTTLMRIYVYIVQMVHFVNTWGLWCNVNRVVIDYSVNTCHYKYIGVLVYKHLGYIHIKKLPDTSIIIIYQ